jgi:hypothetical protein
VKRVLTGIGGSVADTVVENVVVSSRVLVAVVDVEIVMVVDGAWAVIVTAETPIQEQALAYLMAPEQAET